MQSVEVDKCYGDLRAECPFCRELVDQHDQAGCPHFKNALPLGRPVFMFEG